MPDKYRHPDPLIAYRAYYVGDKLSQDRSDNKQGWRSRYRLGKPEKVKLWEKKYGYQ